MFSQFALFFSETLLSLRRHPGMAFAATTCVASALFVAGIVGLAILNADFAVESALDRIRFNVIFYPETNEDDVQTMMGRIKELPGVAGVEYISREDAWERMKKEDPKLVEALGDENPLPDKVSVRADDVSLIPGLAEKIKRWAGVKKIEHAGELTERLENFRSSIGHVGSIVGLILIVLSLVIIHHTIELTLYARRKEIHIMSLVGATPTTVAGPFLLEGVVYGLLGAGIALGGIWLFYQFVIGSVRYITFLQDGRLLLTGAAVILGAGLLLGLVGSIVSVVKYLNQPRSRITNA